MKHFLLFFMACLANMLSIAQKHELVWSSPRKCDNNEAGTYSKIVTTSEKHVYLEYTTLRPSGEKGLKIVSYDKISLNEANTLIINGFKSKRDKQEPYVDKENIDYIATSEGFVAI